MDNINRQLFESSVKQHEGYSAKAYRDTKDILTVGWGSNISFVEDRAYHEQRFRKDADEAAAFAAVWLAPCWDKLAQARQRVVAEMAYQLGAHKLTAFHDFQDALIAGDFVKAVAEMRDSLWYREVTKRAEELCAIMEKGV